MKKLLIVPMLLVLIVFSLYHEDIDGIDSSSKGKVREETLIGEEIVNNGKIELRKSVEVNKSIEEIFSVKILGELNTTKETLVTLRAEVKNAQDLEKCNYFWYENNVLISLGKILEKSFHQGEHHITLVVRDMDGTETNNSVILGAYNYESITKFNYDAYYGNLLYTERTIRNHKGQYLLYDNGTYSKEIMTYDDEHLIERIMEYYHSPEENRKTLFTYDDKGNRLVSQTFNREGVSINYVLNIYDENATLIEMKFGTNAEDINKDEEVYIEVNDENIYAPLVYEAIKIPKEIVKRNENGQLLYEERYYGDTKVINKMTYNDENQLIKSIRSNDSPYDSSSTMMEYDSQGNSIRTERKYEVKGRSSCHYSSSNTYTELGQLKTKVATLLGGVCPYIDEIKRTYTYDEEGNVIKVKASMDDEESEAYTTLKVIKEYVNEIDI